jgi:hypothetical protein
LEMRIDCVEKNCFFFKIEINRFVDVFLWNYGENCRI